jgi:3-dehydroquinate dehydratase II
MKILVINGPNLNLLSRRDPIQYGETGLQHLETTIKQEFPRISFTFKHCNDELRICELLQTADNNFDGIVINPAAFTHTSIAIRDAIEILTIPIIEVHLSNISNREEFRKTQITTSKVIGYISGLKENSYLAAVFILHKLLNNKLN